jgi:hypothetical protein
MPAVPQPRSSEEATLIDFEAKRIERLHSLQILDTGHEQPFDAVVAQAARVTNRPIAVISLVDTKRQWFKACHGLRGLIPTDRDIAFCDPAIGEPGFFEVLDASLDPRFAANPLVVDEPFIRHYAAVPLILDGDAVGTLCVLDRRKGRLSESERDGLERTAVAAVQMLQMRRSQFAARPAATGLTKAFDEVIVVDALSLKIRHVSATALAKLGYSMPELEGCDVSLIGPDYPQELLATRLDKETGDRYRKILTEHRQKDGTHYRVAARIHLRKAQSASSFLILADRVAA